jgi:phosphate transport system protein
MKHISGQYDSDLQQIRDLLMEMGGLVETQVNDACKALVEHNVELAEQVREVESRLNQFEVNLDDQCVSIIAKRQPTAGDLRTVVSVMKVITDLERIGDEADRIAKMAIDLLNATISEEEYNGFKNIHGGVIKMLKRALDAFARLDIENALRVIEDDRDIDIAYKKLVRNCIKQMENNPDQVEDYINLIWSSRSLERIGDHAKNISEYVIYQVKGQDVRHSPIFES